MSSLWILWVLLCRISLPHSLRMWIWLSLESCQQKTPLGMFLQLSDSNRISEKCWSQSFSVHCGINMQCVAHIISLAHFNCSPLITYSEWAVHLHRFHMQTWPTVMLCGWKGFPLTDMIWIQYAVAAYQTTPLERWANYFCFQYVPRPCWVKVRAGGDFKFGVSWKRIYVIPPLMPRLQFSLEMIIK